MDAKEEEAVRINPEGVYPSHDQKSSEDSSQAQIHPEIDGKAADIQLKSPNSEIEPDSIDVSFEDQGPRRRFKFSDFKNRERIGVSKRRVMETAVLIKENVDVILKYLPEKRDADVGQNYDQIDDICNLCNHLVPHPNVLRILGVLHENNCLALVSILQEGDVRDWAKKQQRDVQQHSAVSIQMGEALNHLHQANIIHRDVALRNFLINLIERKEINVKICDFEMCKLLTDKKVYRFDTSTERIPWQNSPIEALKFNVHYPESDVHSFGITLWELFKRGEEPFERHNRKWLTSYLDKYRSAAQLLDLNGIPPKIQLLIECCTHQLPQRRPTMSDVICYLKEGGVEHYILEGFPKYFKKVIDRKRDCQTPGEMPYDDLELKDADSLPPLEPAPHEMEVKHDYEGDDVVTDNYISRDVPHLVDGKLKNFFLKLVKPNDKKQLLIVEKYAQMCYNTGISYESELREYLECADLEDLIEDMFVFSVFHCRKITKIRFEDGSKITKSISRKIVEAIKHLNENPMKFSEVNVRSDGKAPVSPADERLLASCYRVEAEHAGISIRVAGFEEGSIIAKLFMTSDNLERFKEQLNDDESILRSNGVFLRTAELIDEGVFLNGPIFSPEVDAFTFLGGLPSQEQLDCATLLFKYGIYNDLDLREFLSDASVDAELELEEFTDTARLAVSHWMTPQEHGYQPDGQPRGALEGQLKALALAFNRYNKTLELLEECYRNGAIQRKQFNLDTPQQAYNTAKATLGDLNKQDFVPSEGFENTISDLNKFSTDTAQFVVSRNPLLGGLNESGDALHKDLRHPLEAQLWWIASFGMQTQISWPALFNALIDYMGAVCNYPIAPSHIFYKEIQTSLRSCFGSIESGEGWQELQHEIHSIISMKDFKKFYQRFGPWESIFAKAVLLCDPDGRPDHYFFPTESRSECGQYLEDKNLKFAIRFSSRPGNFVYQTMQYNTLIENTPQGFVVTEIAKARDIPGAILQAWGHKEGHHAQMWRKVLHHINETGSKTSYDYAPPADGGTLSGTPGAQEKSSVETAEMKDSDEKAGDQLVTVLRKLDSSKPRLFIVLPANMPDAVDTLIFETDWRLIVLCEGNHLVDRGDEIHLLPHFTKHEALDIRFREHDVLDHLPYIRTGVEFLSRAIKENVIDATFHTDVIVQHLGKGKGTKPLTERLDGFQKKLSALLESLDIPDAAEFIGEDFKDYQSLRNNVFDKWLYHDVSKGMCANLQWSQSGNAGEHTWVCEDHLHGRMAAKQHGEKDIDIVVVEEDEMTEKLREMISMGLTNEKANLRALRTADGNLREAINSMFNG